MSNPDAWMNPETHKVVGPKFRDELGEEEAKKFSVPLYAHAAPSAAAPYREREVMSNEIAKCPKCGTHPFQHWLYGYTHKCHVCGTTWKTEEPAL